MWWLNVYILGFVTGILVCCLDIEYDNEEDYHDDIPKEEQKNKNKHKKNS